MLEIKKTFKVGNVEFDSKEEALKALAMEVLNKEIPLGVQNVINNSSEILKALRIIKK